MKNWWEIRYEKLYADDEAWSVPDDKYVASQVNYALSASGLRPPAAILDLGAGTGRHVADMKRRGFAPRGIEYSRVLVEKGKNLSPDIELITGDMRDLDDIGRYDAITFFDTAFGIFDDAGNAGLLGKVFKALKPGGRVIIDYMNPDFWKRQTKEAVATDYKVKGGKFIRCYAYDENTCRLTDSGKYIAPDGAVEEYPSQILALYPVPVLSAMLRKAGFSGAEFYGSAAYSYPDIPKPVSPDSAFVLAVAKKQS